MTVLTHKVIDPTGQISGFLFFDPGIDGYSITPRSHGLRSALMGKTLEEVICICESFQYSVVERDSD